MYGTIARLRAQPGRHEHLMDVGTQERVRRTPGFVTQHGYRSDTDPNEYWLAVVFESKEAYRANAANSAQDASYRRLRELLADDPEWHDARSYAPSWRSEAAMDLLCGDG
jgi:heme-degrading monooxygenase HmoA